jgi:hypothetical protein
MPVSEHYGMMAIMLNNTHPASKPKETEGGESTSTIASDSPAASLSRLAADILPDDSSEDMSHIGSAVDTSLCDSSEDMSYISAADTSPHNTQPPAPNMERPGMLPFINEASLTANTLGQGDISKDLSAHGPVSQLGMSLPINVAHTASLNCDDVSLLDLSHVSASQHTVGIHTNSARTLCHGVIFQGLSTIDTLSQTDISRALISVLPATDVPAITLNQGDISLSQDPSSTFIVPDTSFSFGSDDTTFWLSGDFDDYLASLACDDRTYGSPDDPPTLLPIPTSSAPPYGNFDLPVLPPIPTSPAPTTCRLIDLDSGLCRPSSGGRPSLPISPPCARWFMNNEIHMLARGTASLPSLHTVLPPASTSPPIADVLETTDATLAATSGTAPSPTLPATSAFMSLPVPAPAPAPAPAFTPTMPTFETTPAPIVTAVSPPILDNGPTIVREPLAAPSMLPNCPVQPPSMSDGVLSVGNGDDVRCSRSGRVILLATRNAAANLIGKENIPTKSRKHVVEDDVLAGTSKCRRT